MGCRHPGTFSYPKTVTQSEVGWFMTTMMRCCITSAHGVLQVKCPSDLVGMLPIGLLVLAANR
jgi:hypothetical protein